MTTLALTTQGPLRCVIGVHVARPVRELDLSALAVPQEITGDHVTLAFSDPLDALLGWRHLWRTFDERAYLMSLIASEAAVEMLREPSDLARETWEWLTARARGTPTPHGLFLVQHVSGLAYGPAFADERLADHGLTLAALGGTRDRVIRVTQPAWIGRTPDAPVRIDAMTVSRRHIELGVDSHEGWFARDGASTGGFYVAAERAGGQRHPLHAGMALQLGGEATVVILAVHS